MSTDVAAERDSQPAQRDELAHSHIVPTCGEVLPPTNVTPPTAITITEDTESLHIHQSQYSCTRKHALLIRLIRTLDEIAILNTAVFAVNGAGSAFPPGNANGVLFILITVTCTVTRLRIDQKPRTTHHFYD